ncbi:unnamed protein product [Parajaminaea phylloscopi]
MKYPLRPPPGPPARGRSSGLGEQLSVRLAPLENAFYATHTFREDGAEFVSLTGLSTRIDTTGWSKAVCVIRAAPLWEDQSTARGMRVLVRQTSGNSETLVDRPSKDLSQELIPGNVIAFDKRARHGAVAIELRPVGPDKDYPTFSFIFHWRQGPDQDTISHRERYLRLWSALRPDQLSTANLWKPFAYTRPSICATVRSVAPLPDHRTPVMPRAQVAAESQGRRGDRYRPAPSPHSASQSRTGTTSSSRDNRSSKRSRARESESAKASMPSAKKAKKVHKAQAPPLPTPRQPTRSVAEARACSRPPVTEVVERNKRLEAELSQLRLLKEHLELRKELEELKSRVDRTSPAADRSKEMGTSSPCARRMSVTEDDRRKSRGHPFHFDASDRCDVTLYSPLNTAHDVRVREDTRARSMGEGPPGAHGARFSSQSSAADRNGRALQTTSPALYRPPALRAGRDADPSHSPRRLWQEASHFAALGASSISEVSKAISPEEPGGHSARRISPPTRNDADEKGSRHDRDIGPLSREACADASAKEKPLPAVSHRAATASLIDTALVSPTEHRSRSSFSSSLESSRPATSSATTAASLVTDVRVQACDVSEATGDRVRTEQPRYSKGRGRMVADCMEDECFDDDEEPEQRTMGPLRSGANLENLGSDHNPIRWWGKKRDSSDAKSQETGELSSDECGEVFTTPSPADLEDARAKIGGQTFPIPACIQEQVTSLLLSAQRTVDEGIHEARRAGESPVRRSEAHGLAHEEGSQPSGPGPVQGQAIDTVDKAVHVSALVGPPDQPTEQQHDTETQTASATPKLESGSQQALL